MAMMNMSKHVTASLHVQVCSKYLIASIFKLSTKSQVCITRHLDDMSECNLLRTGGQCPEYVSWCSPVSLGYTAVSWAWVFGWWCCYEESHVCGKWWATWVLFDQ